MSQESNDKKGNTRSGNMIGAGIAIGAGLGRRQKGSDDDDDSTAE